MYRRQLRVRTVHGTMGEDGQLAVQACALWRPPCDVYETKDLVVVLTEVGGMQQQDFDITFQENSLVIAGKRSDPIPGKSKYHMMEILFGEFCLEVDLPASIRVAGDEITAHYENGFLTVTLPKK